MEKSTPSRNAEENWQRMVRLLRDPRATNGRPDILHDAATMIERLVKHVESAERSACTFEKRTTCSFAVSETASTDARDAARYRWIRDVGPFRPFGGGYCTHENELLSVELLDEWLDRKMVEIPK